MVIFAGLSAGAAYLATRWEHHAHPTRRILFLAPDTGHRYVEAAYTSHRRATPATQLRPQQITELSDMRAPWSRMNCNRAPAPPTAAIPQPTRAAS